MDGWSTKLFIPSDKAEAVFGGRGHPPLDYVHELGTNIQVGELTQLAQGFDGFYVHIKGDIQNIRETVLSFVRQTGVQDVAHALQEWYYLDLSGGKQGPFSQQNISDWRGSIKPGHLLQDDQSKIWLEMKCVLLLILNHEDFIAWAKPAAAPPPMPPGFAMPVPTPAVPQPVPQSVPQPGLPPVPSPVPVPAAVPPPVPQTVPTPAVPQSVLPPVPQGVPTPSHSIPVPQAVPQASVNFGGLDDDDDDLIMADEDMADFEENVADFLTKERESGDLIAVDVGDAMEDVQFSVVLPDVEMLDEVRRELKVYIVVDTNVFISDLKMLKGIRTTVGPLAEQGDNAYSEAYAIVPWIVMGELDKLKMSKKVTEAKGKQIRVSDLARKAIDTLLKAQNSGDQFFKGESVRESRDAQKLTEDLFQKASNDDRILQSCLYFAKQLLVGGHSGVVILLSNDKNLRYKAQNSGILALDCQEFPKDKAGMECAFKKGVGMADAVGKVLGVTGKNDGNWGYGAQTPGIGGGMDYEKPSEDDGAMNGVEHTAQQQPQPAIPPTQPQQHTSTAFQPQPSNFSQNGVTGTSQHMEVEKSSSSSPGSSVRMHGRGPGRGRTPTNSVHSGHSGYSGYSGYAGGRGRGPAGGGFNRTPIPSGVRDRRRRGTVTYEADMATFELIRQIEAAGGVGTVANGGMWTDYIIRSTRILEGAMAGVLQFYLQKEFTDLWVDVAVTEPPWNYKDVYLLMDKHWQSVYRNVFPTAAMGACDELSVRVMEHDKSRGRTDAQLALKAVGALRDLLDKVVPPTAEFHDPSLGSLEVRPVTAQEASSKLQGGREQARALYEEVSSQIKSMLGEKGYNSGAGHSQQYNWNQQYNSHHQYDSYQQYDPYQQYDYQGGGYYGGGGGYHGQGSRYGQTGGRGRGRGRVPHGQQNFGGYTRRYGAKENDSGYQMDYQYNNSGGGGGQVTSALAGNEGAGGSGSAPVSSHPLDNVKEDAKWVRAATENVNGKNQSGMEILSFVRSLMGAIDGKAKANKDEISKVQGQVKAMKVVLDYMWQLRNELAWVDYELAGKEENQLTMERVGKIVKAMSDFISHTYIEANRFCGKKLSMPDEKFKKDFARDLRKMHFDWDIDKTVKMWTAAYDALVTMFPGTGLPLSSSQ